MEAKIVDYAPEYAEDFKKLNYAWIGKYFEIEQVDKDSLEKHKEKILDPGGAIIFALLGEEVVGTVALIKMENDVYELAKMTVSEKARGHGIGRLLGEAIIEKARELGARSVYLESNTKMEAALVLYEKLGFIKLEDQPSPYERCNIQMELKL